MPALQLLSSKQRPQFSFRVGWNGAKPTGAILLLLSNSRHLSRCPLPALPRFAEEEINRTQL
jgi:hypothetical protein